MSVNKKEFADRMAAKGGIKKKEFRLLSIPVIWPHHSKSGRRTLYGICLFLAAGLCPPIHWPGRKSEATGKNGGLRQHPLPLAASCLWSLPPGMLPGTKKHFPDRIFFERGNTISLTCTATRRRELTGLRICSLQAI